MLPQAVRIPNPIAAMVATIGTALTLHTAAATAQQAPAHFPLKTRWAREVSSERVLPEYPRPQLVRSRWQNLNGRWEYAIRDSGAGQPDKYDGTILVPFPVESQLSGVERPVTEQQSLWYRRAFRAPILKPGERLLLHFGAVDWRATVIVNGKQVGEHQGGYDPFTFDITDALRKSQQQELVVRVWDPTDHGAQPLGKQMLHPEVANYTAVTGIWQTVWLEPVPGEAVRALEIIPDVDASVVRLHVTVAGAHPNERVRVVALDGTRPVGTASGGPNDTLAVRIPRARLWSPAHPFLYGLRVSLSGGDQVRSYFGMRKIEVARDSAGVPRIFLNGRPVFQLGLLDQGYWPDGIYTAPTDAALRSDIEQAKRLGFNLLRKHVKTEPERWYYYADRLGMLVWQDMPSGADSSMQENFATELRHIVDALHNHPAIVTWVLFNEGWGQHATKRYVAWLKAYDPTRLVDNASGWNDEGVGNLRDIHTYQDAPRPVPETPDPNRATVLGEFGGLGFVAKGHMWQEGTFSHDQGHGTLEDLNAAYHKTIQLMRTLKSQGVSAAIYTQMTDVEGEANGVLTYDRAVVKLSPESIRDNLELISDGPPDNAAPHPRTEGHQ